MTREEMLEVVYEMIVVDTEIDFVTSHSLENNVITFTTKDDEIFKVSVDKI